MRTLFVAILLVAGSAGFAHAESPSAESLLAEAQTPSEAPAKTDAAAAPAETAPAKAPADAPSPFGAASVLFLGAGIVALGAWGLQKFRTTRSGFEEPSMRHVQSMRLGPKHQVSIVEVEGRRFLIGLAEGAITMLSDVPSAVETRTAPKRPTAPSSSQEEPEGWTDVFAQAREKLATSAGTDGRIINFDAVDREDRSRAGVDAYRSAKHGGRGNIPRSKETDSVVVALERLERAGERS